MLKRDCPAWAPARLDVEAAKVRQLERLRGAAERQPGLLRHATAVVQALLDFGFPQEALAEADRVLALQAADRFRYTDEDDQSGWLLNARGTALEALGRDAEAGEALRLAAAPGPDGRPDVGAAINHGFLRCRLGQPKEALQAIQGLGNLSPYGRMQLEMVRLIASDQLGDAAAVAKARGWLEAHRADSPTAWQRSLVVLGALDAAAAVYLERLEDPFLRSDALLYAQELDRWPGTPTTTRWRVAKAALLARPEVAAALARKGRVERFRLAERP